MSSSDSHNLKEYLLLYASESGQAKAIAEEIAEESPSHGLKARLLSIAWIDSKFILEDTHCVVLIASTTGDGEPPKSAHKFSRRIDRLTLPKNYLENLNYALLALGDSNYIKFANFGKYVDERFRALSAKPFYETGYGDDAYGIEAGTEPWIKGLFPALQKLLGAKPPLINESVDKKEAVLPEYIMDNLSDIEAKALTINDLPQFLKDFPIEKCKLPKYPDSMLNISFLNDPGKRVTFEHGEKFAHFLGSDLDKARLASAKLLSSGDDVKRRLELQFKFAGRRINYKPGDSFGFICQNPMEEVDTLLERLNVIAHAEQPVVLQVPEEYIKKRKVPFNLVQHLSLRDTFLYCVDIRAVPKKVLLRILAESTTDQTEKSTLLFLSSAEGSKVYSNCLRIPSLSILDILVHFPSCKPPVERLLEYLPYLKPRFYSVASSPLEHADYFKIVYNVVNMPKGEGRIKDREGICTGWLTRLATEHQMLTSSVTDKLSALNLNKGNIELTVYRRMNTHFLLPKPEHLNHPLIMVGPGTGVTPFISFLQHIERLLEDDAYPEVTSETLRSCETWLFYGCRYKEKDFLYRTELNELNSKGILNHLVVSFSRDTSSDLQSRYVHESIRQYGGSLCSAIQSGGRIYVCGDAKRMSHDVQQAFIDVFAINLGLSPTEAKTFVEDLQKQHRYVTDVWA